MEVVRAQAGSSAAADLYKNGFIFTRNEELRFTILKMLLESSWVTMDCHTSFVLMKLVPKVTYFISREKPLVFSSSKCGGNNEAGAIIVDKNKIRPVKIDTNI